MSLILLSLITISIQLPFGFAFIRSPSKWWIIPSQQIRLMILNEFPHPFRSNPSTQYLYCDCLYSPILSPNTKFNKLVNNSNKMKDKKGQIMLWVGLYPTMVIVLMLHLLCRSPCSNFLFSSSFTPHTHLKPFHHNMHVQACTHTQLFTLQSSPN
jgi:hypothetical protein